MCVCVAVYPGAYSHLVFIGQLIQDSSHSKSSPLPGEPEGTNSVRCEIENEERDIHGRQAGPPRSVQSEEDERGLISRSRGRGL